MNVKIKAHYENMAKRLKIDSDASWARGYRATAFSQMDVSLRYAKVARMLDWVPSYRKRPDD